ncbi:hypothetical protein FO519_006694 [Halicephalobus sp. NKZ332]|nr:hypothetical protein FO519_006694 [Halicephalobus sp. NKZ332]
MRRVDRPLKVPLESLDMRPFICRPDSKPSTLKKRSQCKIDSEISNGEYSGFGSDEYIYDLVGIVNHYGDRTNSGHYTAVTKNPVDGKWRDFDDMRVTVCEPLNLVYSSYAYLLFYEKRPSLSISARSRPPTRHWFNDIPQEIADRCLRARVSNDTVKPESHVSGVKTLPRPTWTSYVSENGTNSYQGESPLDRHDRSRSFQNLSGPKLSEP